MTRKPPNSLYDLLMQGYIVRESRYQRGYVTRKERTLQEIPVQVAGGRRKNQYYVLMPCKDSTRYCYRVYYYLPKKGK